MDQTTSETPPHESDVERLYRDVERSGALPAGVAAVDAVDAVLCTLVLRLTGGEARDLSAALPPALRRLIARCVRPETERPELLYDEPMFLRLIGSQLAITVEAAERVARAVFAAVQRLVPEDEIWDVENQLPGDLEPLWKPYTASEVTAFEAAAAPGVDVTTGPRPAEEPTESMLREVEQSGVLPAETSAEDALVAVLCTLAAELTGGELRALSEHAPVSLHRLLDRCPRHAGDAPEPLHREAFLQRVGAHLGITDDAAAGRVARAVFAALRGRIPPASVQQIDGRLPRSVRALWRP